MKREKVVTEKIPIVKKYVIVPGPVGSGDGQIHKISGMELVRLYGLNQWECHLLPDDAWFNQDSPKLKYAERHWKDLKWLRPREDGKYREQIKTDEVLSGLGD